MKIATFIMGGIVGAAAAVAIRRSPRWSAAAGMLGRQFKGRMGGMSMEGAFGKMLDRRFSHDRDERKKSSGETASFSKKREDGKGYGDIAHLISQDAGLRDQVNEILSENGQHRI